MVAENVKKFKRMYVSRKILFEKHICLMKKVVMMQNNNTTNLHRNSRSSVSINYCSNHVTQ